MHQIVNQIFKNSLKSTYHQEDDALSKVEKTSKHIQIRDKAPLYVFVLMRKFIDVVGLLYHTNRIV